MSPKEVTTEAYLAYKLGLMTLDQACELGCSRQGLRKAVIRRAVKVAA